MEKAKRFLMEISKNEQLARQLKEVKNKEEFLKVAEAHGYVLTEAEQNDLRDLLLAYAQQKVAGSLSEEELNQVSGGVNILSKEKNVKTPDNFRLF